MLRLFLVSVVIIIFGLESASAQHTAYLRMVDGDSVPMMRLSEVSVMTKRKFKNKRHERRWNRLYRDVIKVYPYAKAAGGLLREIDSELAAADTKPERRQYLKAKERALKEEFEGDLRNMTIGQGKILIKLIDREVGKNCYELITELKSGVNAFLWQTVARLFGSSLKYEYDPEEEKDIELIIRSIENS